MTRRFVIVTIACLSILASAGTALAGSWATTSVDDAPDEFRAGTTYDVRYTVLQHGRTAVESDSTALVFERGGELLRFRGSPTGVPGQYVAEVELPSTGTWEWSAEQGPFFPVDLGTVEVHPASGFFVGDAVAFVVPLLALGVVAMVVVRLRQASSPNSAPASRMTSST